MLRDALKPHRSTLTPKLWTVLESAKPGDASLLPAASALADYDPITPRGKSVGGKVAQALVVGQSRLSRSLARSPATRARQADAPLAAIFRDKSRPETEHTLATNILADYASDDPDLIADLLMDADPKAYAAFFPIAQRQEAKTLPLFQAEIDKKATIPESDKDSETVKDRLAERQARAAVALLRMGKAEEVMPLLRHSADPRLRSFIVNWLSPLGADPKTIAAELDRLAANRQAHARPGATVHGRHPLPPRDLDAAGVDPGTGDIRDGRAVSRRAGAADRQAARPLPQRPRRGIHGAAEWTLRQWGQQEKLKELDAELMKLKDRGERRWYVNGQGQTFAVIEGPVEFRMGSPPTEPERIAETRPHAAWSSPAGSPSPPRR